MAEKNKKLKDELNLKKQKWEVMINFYFEKLDNKKLVNTIPYKFWQRS
jgi:hypothetical protein